MESRNHLYVNRKSVTVWLMVLGMIASVISRIVLFSGNGVWSGVVWPCAAAILYALITVFSGEEMFYHTAIPVWLFGLNAAIRQSGVLVWLLVLFFCVAYTVMTGGRIKRTWLLLPLYLLVLGMMLYVGSGLPDLLMIISMVILLPAVKVHRDGKWHPAWGDRIDGRRVRTAPAMEQITAYFMPNRNRANMQRRPRMKWKTPVQTIPPRPL